MNTKTSKLTSIFTGVNIN